MAAAACERKDASTAVRFLRKAAHLALQQPQESALQASTFMSLGTALLKLERYEEALSCFRHIRNDRDCLPFFTERQPHLH
eukprot:m.276732 g.276732  ORF g.276732 m.276732 type:complete len:81 (+) comp108770_c0_seq1:187-429(+)